MWLHGIHHVSDIWKRDPTRSVECWLQIIREQCRNEMKNMSPLYEIRALSLWNTLIKERP